MNIVRSNSGEWWIERGVARHAFFDRDMFTTYEMIQIGHTLLMGNMANSATKGKGNVNLKITSGKQLTLKDVLYVLEIRNNLVLGLLLNMHSLCLVF